MSSAASPSHPPRAPVVLVTGAARRIGRAIALELAARGMDVAVHTHHHHDDAEQTCAAVRAAGRRCALLQADLADEAQAGNLLPAAVAALGAVDHVVHNASAFVYDNLQSFAYARLDEHVRIGAGAAVLLARALHAGLQARARRGALVLMLDQRLWNPNPDYLSYTLGKAALQALTGTLAKALAPAVRVVGVAPGLALGSTLIDEPQLERLGALSLTGRTVQASEIADTVAFALRNEALTGSTLMVDAGYHLQPLPRDFPFL